jgi:hypothetical protein
MAERLSLAYEGLICLHKMKDYPRQFLGRMGNGHVVGFAFGALFR